MGSIYTVIAGMALAALSLQPFSEFGLNDTKVIKDQSNHASRTADSLELVKFYHAMNGPNWINSWTLTEPMDSWHGLELDSIGRVIRLRVSQNDLKGEIYDIKLSSLITLVLNGEISGELPDFQGMPNLVVLEIGYSITGTIPNFSGLPELQKINLRHNKLTGTIPNFSGLPQLTHLELQGNNLVGSIPEFSNLINLRLIRANGNELSSPLPKFINSKELHTLDISSNNFMEPVPAFNGLLMLTNVDLAQNMFYGEIPDFQLPELGSLQMQLNNISGTIPDFSGIPSLWDLELGSNPIFSKIPNFSNLSELRFLEIFGCLLYDTIPNFSNLSKLEALYLGNNMLSGKLPNFKNMKNLREIAIQDNGIVGPLPALDSCNMLEVLNLKNNLIESTIPNYGISHPFLKLFRIEENALTFEDLLPAYHDNLDTLTGNEGLFIYAGQDSIFIDTLFWLNEKDTIKFDLAVDDTVTTNSYRWFKDGWPYKTIHGTNELVFDNLEIADEGTYRVVITNSIVKDLTLYSHDITLRVNGTTSVADTDLVDVRIMPNPSNDMACLSTDVDNGFILDVNGTISYILEPNQKCVDVRDFPPGLYYFVVEIGLKKSKIKLVVN